MAGKDNPGKIMIDILLATYNSARFIRAQIDSILAQDCRDWQLLIRDGGSEDDTLDIIRQFCSNHSDRIRLLPSCGRSTVMDNFSALLEVSSASYVMFADHDDVWLKDKVGKSLTAMNRAEAQYGTETPLLIFTDMHVVDEKLNPLANSYFNYQRLNPARTELNYLLVQNIPSGCTMMINRQLTDWSLPLVWGAVMHDHWIALVAGVFGRIFFLDDATLLYRQHSDNIFGASKYGGRYLWAKWRGGKERLRERLLRNVIQAEAFLQAYDAQLNAGQREMLRDFSSLRWCSGFQAWRVFFKHRIFKNGLMRNLGMYYLFL